MNYTIELEVEKPRDEVAKLFMDDASLPYWQPGFVSSEHLSGDAGEVGARSMLLYNNRGRDVEMIETIIANNPPEEFTATFEAKGMKMTVKNLFYEAGENKTRWVSENDAQTSGLMMKIIGVLMPGCFKKESMKYNVAFKAFAETGADVRDCS